MQDGCWPFHLFGAHFVTETDAQKFVFEQWEPEPPESTWGDRRSTSTQVEPLVRLPQSTATTTYLGLFN